MFIYYKLLVDLTNL